MVYTGNRKYLLGLVLWSASGRPFFFLFGFLEKGTGVEGVEGVEGEKSVRINHMHIGGHTDTRMESLRSC